MRFFFSVFASFSLMFFFVPLVFAQDSAPETESLPKAPPIYTGDRIDTGASDRYSIEGLKDKLLPGAATWIAGFLASLAVIFLIVAGIQFLLAGGDPEKITKASKTAFFVLGGLALALFAYAIVYLFLTLFSLGP